MHLISLQGSCKFKWSKLAPVRCTLTSSAYKAAWICLWADESLAWSCFDCRFSSMDLSTTPTQYETISVRRFQFSKHAGVKHTTTRKRKHSLPTRLFHRYMQASSWTFPFPFPSRSLSRNWAFVRFNRTFILSSSRRYSLRRSVSMLQR